MQRDINKKNIQIRLLKFYTDKPFIGMGSDLRRAVTARFKDNPILHNHLGKSFNYDSPRVRYLVLDHVPYILSFESGLDIVEEIYKKKPSLRVHHREYKVLGTELEDRFEYMGLKQNSLNRYTSITPWLALNEKNYPLYLQFQTFQEKREFLSTILIGNLLSLSKKLNLEITHILKVNVFHFEEEDIVIDHVNLKGFNIIFDSNYVLPYWVGIGKYVSKGFGIMKLNYSESTKQDDNKI
jgi:hypothetical protein